MAVLPVFVSDQAWLETPWLYEGLEIWQEHFGFPRDFFLPLPTPDMKDVLRIRAAYTDSAGFGQSLLASLAALAGRLCCLRWRPTSGPSTLTVLVWTDGSLPSGWLSPSAAFLGGGPPEAQRTSTSELPVG